MLRRTSSESSRNREAGSIDRRQLTFDRFTRRRERLGFRYDDSRRCPERAPRRGRDGAHEPPLETTGGWVVGAGTGCGAGADGGGGRDCGGALAGAAPVRRNRSGGRDRPCAATAGY